MRVTGGKLKGWQIRGGFAAHVRPTTDMMREAVFNKLSHGIGIEERVVLDIFSGSGIMSVEFLSRGAGRVVSIDFDQKNTRHQQALKVEKGLEAWEIGKMDVLQFLRSNEEKFDIIFADPPYDLPAIQNMAILAVQSLSDEGLFVLEHRPGILFQDNVIETKKYGSTAITIFAK